MAARQRLFRACRYAPKNHELTLTEFYTDVVGVGEDEGDAYDWGSALKA